MLPIRCLLKDKEKYTKLSEGLEGEKLNLLEKNPSIILQSCWLSLSLSHLERATSVAAALRDSSSNPCLCSSIAERMSYFFILQAKTPEKSNFISDLVKPDSQHRTLSKSRWGKRKNVNGHKWQSSTMEGVKRHYVLQFSGFLLFASLLCLHFLLDDA